ncbi:hypothetical protein SAY87_009464 [Trapa incisa]|uniref:C2H2-type domain-containing protein n=1 Tax=Trapa incisa TaxID=236973 RepID=A0AAN7JZ00_9MYRT|nr:hypothetical protein SAY87_009464 [Trapa incisa]
MEKNNSLSKTLKDHLVRSNAAHHGNLHNPGRLLSSTIHHNSGCQNYGRSEDDYLTGISWPPRSYSCSFCKREFRSAQALGGHMNVHRRDRARLRQSSPDVEVDLHQHPFLSLSTNPSPNPNPNQLSPASSASPSIFIDRCSLISRSATSPPPFPSLFSSSSSLADRDIFGTLSLRSKASESKLKTARGASIRVPEMGGRHKYQLDGNVEMDLLGGSNNDYIDLELRLGCP